jgi:choline dehydrogenase-like flavoprotein
MVEETDIAVVGAGGGGAVLALDRAEEQWLKKPTLL